MDEDSVTLQLLNWVNLSSAMGTESLRECYREKKNGKACTSHVIADMSNAT